MGRGAGDTREAVGGKKPGLTMEQTARALNVVCRCWQERRRNSRVFEHAAAVINHHQARSQAVRDSRL